MESTNQGIPLGGNPSPFSSWGDVGAPHMATLSLPGLTIGLPVWLFSTSVVQNTTIPEQSKQQLDESRVSHQPSTSSNSSSPPSSSLDRAGKAKSQVPKEKKEKKKKEKKKEPKANGGKRVSSNENPHTAPTRPKSPCVICKGDHFHRDCPCIPRILRDWYPLLHNPVRQPLMIMLKAHHQLAKVKPQDKEGKLDSPADCAKAITPSTVVPS